MRRLVIVDDEYFFRQGLKQLIPWGEYGLSICGEAKNGREALELIDALKPDAMLLDINMPVMGGLQLLSALRERGDRLQVILLTGYGEFEYAQQALRLGALDYLLKPVTADDLAAAARKLQLALYGHAHDAAGRTAAHTLSDRAKAYVQAHYAESTLSERAIAGALFVNPSHLSAAFRKATGETLNQYIVTLRMRRAQQLMEEGNGVILVIAEQVGFEDANYFGKCFKRFTGLTPRQYMNRKQS